MMKYDLENERSYWQREDGTKLCVGSAGSCIIGCFECGNEMFRNRAEEQACVWCGKRAVPLTFNNSDAFDAVWLAAKPGRRLTTVEERRAKRLEEETQREMSRSA